ncbi:MAG: 30S ribosomal protein S17 [Chloroflexi bacterium]|nr:30S ribosomal protein S17 [Chloroflexota bacterium]
MARKTQIGFIISGKNDKTVIVGVSWLQKDRIYKKSSKKLTKFVAHDELNSATIGDKVLIEETRPYSKTKRWRVVEILEKVDYEEVNVDQEKKI